MNYLLRNILFGAFLVVLMVLSVSCNKDTDGPILVEIEGHTIDAEQFYNSVPPKVWEYMSEDEKKAYLNQYIDKELIVQDVHRRSLDEQPMVKSRLYEARQEILGQVFSDVLVNPRITIESDEIKEYYRKHQVQFARDEDEVWIYQLIFRDENIADSAYSILEEFEDSITLKDFINIADSFLIDTTDIDQGFVSKEHLISDVKNKIKKAKPGSLLEPVKSPVGFAIIYYKDLGKEGTLHPLESVRAEIEDIIFTIKQSEIQDALIDSLREYHKPVINQAVLDSLLMENKDL